MKTIEKQVVATTKKQTGFRLPEAWLLAMSDLKTATGIPQQTFFEDATTLFFGKNCELARERQKIALKAFASGRVKRPFEEAPIFFTTATV